MDRASDSGSECWGFESLRAYQNERTSERMSFRFGLRPPEATSALRYLNARGQQSRPCAIPGRRPGIYGALAPPAKRPVGWFSYTFLRFQNIDFNHPFQKKKDTTEVVPFFLDFSHQRLPPNFLNNMLGEMNSPCAKIFASQKYLYGANVPSVRRTVIRSMRL